MIALVVAALGVLGGTTWLALQQPIAHDPARNRRLTAAGLMLCLVTAVVAIAAAVVTAP
ncbi:hypothetical protein [Actinoplanes sp. CA-252034]|uniref:hypothetical protein n=1 Tax=Actinoplanes sp. CA-252034 TaxID=3239906 RepID=UPI003D956357